MYSIYCVTHGEGIPMYKRCAGYQEFIYIIVCLSNHNHATVNAVWTSVCRLLVRWCRTPATNLYQQTANWINNTFQVYSRNTTTMIVLLLLILLLLLLMMIILSSSSLLFAFLSLIWNFNLIKKWENTRQHRARTHFYDTFDGALALKKQHTATPLII